MLDGPVRELAAAARMRLRHPWTPGIRRRPLSTLDFVVVDVETTGWSPDADGITEIGAVRLSGGQVRAEFAALVNPGRLIPPDIVTLTGITDAMVTLAPPVGAVLPRFLDFARGSVLTAHNAPFDVGFLSAACAGTGRRWPAPPVLDTVMLARLLLTEDEVPNCKLATLADFFAAPATPRHRALADARATAAVLAALLDRLAATGVRTLAQLSAAERAAARRPAAHLSATAVQGPQPAAEQRYATPEGPGRRP
ncbi:MAG TPA: exonuclease domain-containing protein [Streptosporangiaceae bacterium]|jgi:DNA polymerase-3 subunit epsilon|nr:exonuclease domain-containing protein [Streptosporangiaceae bacterium]